MRPKDTAMIRFTSHDGYPVSTWCSSVWLKLTAQPVNVFSSWIRSPSSCAVDLMGTKTLLPHIPHTSLGNPPSLIFFIPRPVGFPGLTTTSSDWIRPSLALCS